VVNRHEFVAEVSRRSGLNRHDADRAVQAVLDTITETLKRGDDVSFTGFGKFTTQERAARTGVNPRDTSQKVEIPAARVPKFSAGSALKSAVRQ
jgi:DNA-binding protein HU-beta